ncbi:sensor histidine kinase ['Paenibacillus yunnanensis' Narsing Rao et al. 2020]|uniref:sensor histidine kinase n=1 Tax=Paenibacillus tengchongensis TaxID=2608684 RepID=UPI00124D5426|nr:sensor histidine kinase [Paenibacillus tengchongensis]
MTAALLGVMIAVLLVVIGWQSYRSRQKARQLQYIHEKLDSIMERSSHERLLLLSDHPEVRMLLTALNRLLDVNHKGAVERAQLEHSMRNMLANVSHDLKTPLTVVLGYIETLQHDGGELPEAQRLQMLETIRRKAEEVIALMNRFFDLAKLESGDKDIPLSKVDVGEVCRSNILAFYDLLSSKGSKVEVEIPEEPLYMLGNEEALTRVLSNLISNSIAYGDAGGVLGLRVYGDQEGRQVSVEVWDRGKGIPDTHLEKVFERLYTLEDSRNRSYQGSGLGLTITKRLTEQMKGSITLDSKPYVKTVFTLTFPRLNY